ncbi:Flagellar hook-associated protein [Thiobacillus denitrificans ATCC 25259]|uniref:Flagellar hook-associated protein 1 n=1 Tax=Thiobacillus denitrificans (strain ATCC 25259 / T1) TaxID=292415 RepID=Q3SIE7_THIDA|nr:flagellar hook-associated protein FlgK [Thiobacillus denitrificans]AAZ97581.1 Flagellar hook-associated protein [Thiobacillus denitrificans ATCC 25259]
MATSILGIGQSALAAAQAGLSTTGHNIANASTPGYSRQVVVQGAALPQNFGFGFMGQGTQIETVKRVYNEYLGVQVQTAQASKSGLDSYYAQIKQIDNLLADPASGLSPSLQDFFSGIQELAANPGAMPSRQAALSSAEALASRFNSLAGRLDEIEQGVNSQIVSSVDVINTYAEQIARLNDAIGKAQRASGQPANDLLDQRDQLILDLNKEIKATVVKQGDGAYNVFIGNGQPLVVGGTTSRLSTMASPTNPERIEVAYQASDGSVSIVGESGLVGGKLGGLVEFRTRTLEPAQNALGRVAIGLASSFNAQHRLGIDLNGAAGGEFFTTAGPVVTANTNNASTSTAAVAASISDVGALTTSDYRLQYDGSSYTLTRVSDRASWTVVDGQTVDGVTLSLSGTAAAGDSFLIRPTVAGASQFAVAITDPAKIAAAAPIRTAAANTNTGSGAISAGTVDSTYPAMPLGAPVTLTYDALTNTLSDGAGFSTTYAPGATISFGGISFTLSGTPADNDSFTVEPNTNGVGDNRNALLLGGLQSANTLGNGTISYQGAYSQFVSQIGNKTRELEVTSSAAGKLLSESTTALQNESGVNLDEEATNLLRYQQAYQAAAKVMQVASEMFDALLTIGR